jgi:hypothetical protein
MNEILKEAGYTLWDEGTKHLAGRVPAQLEVHKYQKRVDTLPEYRDITPCQLNNKLFINISVTHYNYAGDRSVTATIDIAGEDYQGEWCDLSLYSISLEKLEQNLGHYEDRIVSLWGNFIKGSVTYA